MEGQEEIAQFERVYTSSEREILRYVGFQIADKALAQDIAAQAFLRLWEKVRAKEPIGNPRALVYTIARGLVIDEYRRRGRRKDLSLDLSDMSLFVDETDPFVETEKSLNRKKVLTMTRQLKQEYQDVILMHYISDMPIKDIAEILQESENLVRVRLHRALAALKKGFEKEKTI
jgi:RNA polymerase sigma-70 factor, ECF subfamily